MPDNSLFIKELNKKIQTYIVENGRYATPIFWVKAILLISVWLSMYIYLVFYAEGMKILHFYIGLLWGIVSLLIVFNIGHDAVHGVVSKYKLVNQILSYTFNLVGGNAYSWKLKHNLAHHIHTNIEGKDFDTNLQPLLRVSTQTPFQKHYRWQLLWLIPVYSLLSLLIIFVADFKIFFQTKNAGIVRKHPVSEWMILIASKFFYITIAIILPITFSSYSPFEIIITFILFHLINGIIIACVFMPSHYFPKSRFYSPTAPKPDWHLHQLQTTMDLSPDSFIVSLLLGSLNLNIAHHLYPHLCHPHYFKLSAIIREHCTKWNIECHQMNYTSAILTHLVHIKNLSNENV